MSELDELAEVMKKTIPEEKLLEMVHMVHRLGTLGAIDDSKSIDPKVVGAQMHHNKGGIVPLEEMVKIATNMTPILVTENLINDDGSLTEEGRWMIDDYNKRLNSDCQTMPIH